MDDVGQLWAANSLLGHVAHEPPHARTQCRAAGAEPVEQTARGRRRQIQRRRQYWRCDRRRRQRPAARTDEIGLRRSRRRQQGTQRESENWANDGPSFECVHGHLLSRQHVGEIVYAPRLGRRATVGRECCRNGGTGKAPSKFSTSVARLWQFGWLQNGLLRGWNIKKHPAGLATSGVIFGSIAPIWVACLGGRVTWISAPPSPGTWF